MKTISGLAMGLFIEAIMLCLLASFRFVNLQSTATLLIFNALFVSLTFQLNGTFNRKLGLLALGNATGLFWNFIFHSFALAATTFFGEISNTLYMVFYPFLNSLWVVSFWSLSLTALHRPESASREIHL